MDGAVYRLFFYNSNPQETRLAEADKLQLEARQQALSQEVGRNPLLVARMQWSSERYQYFGVSLYPSLSALQRYVEGLNALGVYPYALSDSFLGIPLDGTADQTTPPEPLCADDTPIYRVYLSRLTPYGHTKSPEELQQANAEVNAEARRCGAQVILSAYTRWNNERWEYFGVERYPCMDALVRYSQFLTVTNWYAISEARSYLGTAVSENLIF